ncbi:MAG: prepilin-type N-terminal cleavage/methylation domain-containing protein [Candidatus Moranbacteria bacterium]|nr:prepilin-type N-terminal cleavage/methylation domain-containing protein [Candidatus Moranbacteria bacterium]
MKNSFHKKNKNKRGAYENNRGFTLLEILISIGIIGILSATMLQVTNISDTHKKLSIEANRVMAHIRMAQSYALSIPQEVSMEARHVCGFGFYPDNSNSYKVFYIYNTDFADQPNLCEKKENFYFEDGNQVDGLYIKEKPLEEITLADGYQFSEFGSIKTIFFKAPYGRNFYDGSELDALTSEAEYEIEKADGSQSMTIKISRGGNIKIE